MTEPKAPKPPKPMISIQGEMDALAAIMIALEKLDKEQRSRVLRYARDFYGIWIGDT